MRWMIKTVFHTLQEMHCLREVSVNERRVCYKVHDHAHKQAIDMR